MKYCDFKRKEVVNVLDGKSLGYVCDMVIDPCDGRILSIIMPGHFKLSSIFVQGHTYCVPWCNICKIGEDVILVKADITLSNYR